MKLPAAVRRALRWSLIAIALLIALPIVAAVFIASFEISLSAGPWRDRLGEAASKALGRRVTLEGPLELVPSLRPLLKVGGIRIANPPGFSSAEFAYLGEARLHVDLAALLREEIRVHELSAENVHVQLEHAADGAANWRFPRKAAQPAPASEEKSGRPDLSRVEDVEIDVRDVTLRNLSVEYFAAAAGTRHYFQLEALKAAAQRDRPVTVALRGTVEKQFPYALTFTGGKAADLLQREVRWPVQISFDFLGTVVQVEGMVVRDAEGEQVDLLLGMGTEDLSQIERLLQIELPEVGATALSTRIHWAGPRLTLSDVRGVMGRTTLDGELRFDTSGARPRVSGHLALPTLDMRPFLGMQPTEEEAPRSLLDTYRELEQQTFSLRALDRMDIDLDLSVERWLSLPGDVRDARLELRLENGKLHAPVQATIAQVPLHGMVEADGRAALPTFLLELQARKTRLGGLAELLAGVRGIEGDLGSFLLRLSGQGENLGQLTRTVDVRLGITDSRLSYGNVEGGRPVDFRLDDLDVRLPSAKPLGGRARGSLLGEPFDARFSATDLPTLARTLRSPLKLTARASGATLDVDGTLAAPEANSGSALRFRLAAQRAGDVGRWLGLSPTATAALQLSGHARATAREWRLDDYQFRLGRTRMSGTFARVGLEQQPLIQAHVDLDHLDVPELESMLPPAPAKPQQAEAPSRNTLDLPILPQGIDLSDADVEVRARRINMQRADVTDASFSGRIRDGKMDPSPFAARIAGTAFSGAVALDLRGSLPQASLWIAANEVDVGDLLRRLKITQDLEASVDSLRLQLIGRGSRLGEMLEKSELDVNLEDGNLSLRDPAGKPLVKIAVRSGRALAEPGEPVRVDLSGDIDQTPVTIGVTTGTALSFLQGSNKVPFSMRAEAAGARLDLTGRVTVPITQAEGELELRIQGERLDSLNPLARVELPPWGPWSLGGRFVASARGYEVPDLSLRIGDSRLDGRGTYASGAQRPRVDVRLTAPRIQLNDFQFGTWSPFEKKEKPDATPMTVEEIRAKAKEAAEQGQRLLSLETLRRMDAYLDVQVEEVLSGRDRLGSGTLHAQLDDGSLQFGPAQVNVPGGSAQLSATYQPTPNDVGVTLQIAADRFDYGILARRVKPDTDFEGLLSLRLDLSGRARTLDSVMAHGNGRIDFAVWPRNMRSGIFDLWAVNLFMALVPAVDPAAESKVNCAIGRFDLRDGKLSHDAILIDTSRMRVLGSGSVDFDSERLDFRLAPRAKSAQFFSLATPIAVTGTLTDQKIGVAPGGVAETTVRLLTSVFVVPIQKLTQGRLPRDGADICNSGVRIVGAR
ncbi:MAG: AsmA family protein [Burkholderiales bacterium]|nr:AsmA family protein [Burkholderiales bacterium]